MVAVGVKAPGILLLSFVPMFFIAAAFYYMNRVDTDCGTTFSWVTRAMGPYAGWIGGWAICTTGILVIGSLADVSALFFYDLFDLNDLRKSDIANVASRARDHRRDDRDLRDRDRDLGPPAAGADPRPGRDPAAVRRRRLRQDRSPARCPTASIDPELSWLSPFGVEYSGLLTGVLLGVFIYWGWESAVNLSEESEDSSRAPGSPGSPAR